MYSRLFGAKSLWEPCWHYLNLTFKNNFQCYLFRNCSIFIKKIIWKRLLQNFGHFFSGPGWYALTINVNGQLNFVHSTQKSYRSQTQHLSDLDILMLNTRPGKSIHIGALMKCSVWPLTWNPLCMHCMHRYYPYKTWHNYIILIIIALKVWCGLIITRGTNIKYDWLTNWVFKCPARFIT